MSASTKTNETLHDSLVELLAPTDTDPGPLSLSGDDNATTKTKSTDGLVTRLTSLCWLERTEDHSAVVRAVAEAVKIYHSLGPQDTTESLLCEQMVGNHLAINKLLRRAANSEYHDTTVKYCKTAALLQGQVLKQAAFLDKHRGRNPQKVVVEHVNVEPGGQAIVGHLETRESKS